MRSSSRGRHTNWSIIIGLVIVAMTVILALLGPSLAMRDPLERTYVMPINDRMQGPPFPAFVDADFPLGSDRYGRDLLSQLLWAVRPTLILVVLVTVLRLVLGTMIGVTAAWSTSRLARAVDTVLTLAVSVPVFFVALGCIALLGATNAALAFVVGLTVTGWAETAQLVRNETKVVRGQQYIEAVRALGQSELGIVMRHVLRQLLPMLLVMLAVEMAAALLAVAALGYLGYYIGGDAWVMATDFVAQRLSGLPELGQLLGVTSETRDQPLGMVIVGTVIFIIVMGFNLLGNGLRSAFALQNLRRSSIYLSAVESIGAQMSERMLDGLAVRKQRRLVYAALSIVIFLVVVAGVGIVVVPQVARSRVTQVTIPGDHQWASTRRDAQGTLRSSVSGLMQPTARLVFSNTAGLTGGPAITRDGVLIMGTADKQVVGIDAQGAVLWQTALTAVPIGTPALGPADEIYVADVKGGLTRLNMVGQVVWYAKPPTLAPAMSGPIVDARGNAYVLAEGYLWSTDPQGKVRWQAPVPYAYFNTVARLSMDYKTIFFADTALDANSGAIVLKESPAPLDQFITGAEGQIMLHADKSLLEWRVSAQGTALVEYARLDYERYFPNTAEADAGTVPDQGIWLLMSSEYTDARLIWSDSAGKYRGSVGFAQRPTRIVGLDRDFTLYACGLNRAGDAECLAFEQGAQKPRWQLTLQKNDEVIGGALASGRLYVSTRLGFLFELTDAQ